MEEDKIPNILLRLIVQMTKHVLLGELPMKDLR